MTSYLQLRLVIDHFKRYAVTRYWSDNKFCYFKACFAVKVTIIN